MTLSQLQIAEMHSQGGKFKKDDHLVDGMKADAIYEETRKWINFVNIEMKSQIDPKQFRKNSTFWALYQNKLKKNADVAVLVSVLEPNNEFYNRGIVPIINMKICMLLDHNLLIVCIHNEKYLYQNMEEKDTNYSQRN